MKMLLFVVALLPLLAGTNAIVAEYMEDHCNSPQGFPVSKDFLLKFSSWRSYLPASYTCPMLITNRDPGRQVQVRILHLDTLKRSDCSAGAVIVKEGSKFFTPSYGVCGTKAPNTIIRTLGSNVTIEVTNKGSSIYGDFSILVTSIYKGTNSSGKACNGDDFHCANGYCVSSRTICNGYNDCGDDSDEHEGCALAAAVIVGIVFSVFFVIIVFAAVGVCFRRRRRYVRVTRIVREYPSVSGGYQSI